MSMFLLETEVAFYAKKPIYFVGLKGCRIAAPSVDKCG